MPSTPSNTKKPADRKPKAATIVRTDRTPGQVWGKKKTEDLELPSGEICLVKRTGIQGLIKAGVLESMDTLTGIVQMELIPTAEGKPNQANAMMALANNAQGLQRVVDLMDKIVLEVVVEPTVLPAPAENEPRDEDAIYVDEIDLEDKMFIFNFATGGSKDLERFRAESAAAMGSLGVVQDPEVPTV